MLRKHHPRRARKVAKQLRDEGVEPTYSHEWRYLCGTLYEMPKEPTVKEMVAAADNAVKFAQSTRKLHGRRSPRGGKQREADIKAALTGLRRAMKPIRRRIGRLPYMHFEFDAAPLRVASDAIQKERRKLWKMKAKK